MNAFETKSSLVGPQVERSAASGSASGGRNLMFSERATSALSTMTSEIWNMVEEYIAFVKGNGYFEHRRNEQAKYWMYETIDEQLRNSFFQNPEIVTSLAEAESMVLSGRQTSFVAAKQLLDAYFDSVRGGKEQ